MFNSKRRAKNTAAPLLHALVGRDDADCFLSNSTQGLQPDEHGTLAGIKDNTRGRGEESSTEK